MIENFGLSKKTVRIALEALDSMPDGSMLESMSIDERRFLGLPVSRHVAVEWTSASDESRSPIVGVE